MIDTVTGTKGHMKKKKTSSLSPSSRHSLRSIQLQDLIDHSEQMVNHRTADQLLLSMRVSEEDRHIPFIQTNKMQAPQLGRGNRGIFTLGA